MLFPIISGPECRQLQNPGLKAPNTRLLGTYTFGHCGRRKVRNVNSWTGIIVLSPRQEARWHRLGNWKKERQCRPGKKLGYSTRVSTTLARTQKSHENSSALRDASQSHYPVIPTETGPSVVCGVSCAYLGPDILLSLLSDPLCLGNPHLTGPQG